MKNFKKWTALGLAALMVIGTMAGCAKKETPKETQAATNAPAESAAQAEVKEETYESKDGWKITYNPKVFAKTEGNNGEVSFAYLGEAAGNNTVTISYHKDKSPNEILYEKTADADQMKVVRTEGWFGGTYPNWTYTREVKPEDSKKGVGEHYTGIEHNGGTLLVSVLYHSDDNEERNMDTSDNISGLLDSLKFTNHQPQQETMDKVGTYVRQYKEEIEGQVQTFTDSITLNEDRTGVMSFQDDIPIIWSSIELIERDGNNRYEYTQEGDMIMVNMNDGGEWLQFEKKK